LSTGKGGDKFNLVENMNILIGRIYVAAGAAAIEIERRRGGG
jgi:hypothetical protein